jgi:hypothetical protein
MEKDAAVMRTGVVSLSKQVHTEHTCDHLDSHFPCSLSWCSVNACRVADMILQHELNLTSVDDSARLAGNFA